MLGFVAAITPFVSFGHCRSPNQSTPTVKAGEKCQKKQTEVFFRFLFLLRVCKRNTPHCAVTTFTAIGNNGVSKWAGGIGSVLRIMDAGKGCVGKRRGDYEFQQIREKHVENFSVALCFFLSLHSSLLFHFLILSPSLLCLCLELVRSLIQWILHECLYWHLPTFQLFTAPILSSLNRSYIQTARAAVSLWDITTFIQNP